MMVHENTFSFSRKNKGNIHHMTKVILGPPFRGVQSVSHTLTTHGTKPAGVMLPLTDGAVILRPPECVTFPSLFSPCSSYPVLKACYGEEKEKLLLITLDSARSCHKGFFH